MEQLYRYAAILAGSYSVIVSYYYWRERNKLSTVQDLVRTFKLTLRELRHSNKQLIAESDRIIYESMAAFERVSTAIEQNGGPQMVLQDELFKLRQKIKEYHERFVFNSRAASGTSSPNTDNAVQNERLFDDTTDELEQLGNAAN